MKTLKYGMLAAAALTLLPGFTSCSDEKPDPEPEPKKITSASFNIQITSTDDQFEATDMELHIACDGKPEAVYPIDNKEYNREVVCDAYPMKGKYYVTQKAKESFVPSTNEEYHMGILTRTWVSFSRATDALEQTGLYEFDFAATFNIDNLGRYFLDNDGIILSRNFEVNSDGYEITVTYPEDAPAAD